MSIASHRRTHPHDIVRLNFPSFKQTARAIVFGALTGALCSVSAGMTGAHAQAGQPAGHCRSAADEAELKTLEKELDSLKGHRWRLEALKADDQRQLAVATATKESLGWPEKKDLGPQYDRRIDALNKSIGELDAALKENAARLHDVQAKIAALKALAPCTPSTVPATPPAGPGTAPPPAPAHPCRTPEDEKTLAALKAKRDLDVRELNLLERLIKSYGKSYDQLKRYGQGEEDKRKLESVDKQLTEYQRQRPILEAEIAELEAKIKALLGLKPCTEEHWTTPQPTPPGTTPGTEKPPAGTGKTPAPKHPRKPVKHGKHAVSEDSPLYMQNYTPPAKTTTRRHSSSGDTSNAPPEEPKDETNDKPPGDTQPEIPVPH